MIKNLSNLARIRFNPQEEEDLKKDIASVLGYIDELKEANISHKQQDYFQSDLKSVFREDVAVDFNDKDLIIDSFNDKEGRLLKVKPIL